MPDDTRCGCDYECGSTNTARDCENSCIVWLRSEVAAVQR